MFFAGDLGQRIFQQPFSWLALGVDVRGRSQTLKVNYRTSHQIRQSADRLLPRALRDVDGLIEDRTGTVSVFDGPPPTVVFVRSDAQLARARAAVAAADAAAVEVSGQTPESAGRVAIGVMHLAKGLEFKCVIAMACDLEVLPLQERIDTVTDEAELDDVYETERQLFYVACTRARDRLMVSGVAPGSEFMQDLNRPSF
jgi:superfamily I DNA/RNA helicase